MRGAFAFLLFSLLVLVRFGINLGSFSLEPSVIAMYLLLAIGLTQAAFRVSLARAALYGLCIALGGLSLYANLLWGARPNTSFGSLALIGLLYFPYVFVLRQGALSEDDTRFAYGVFLNLSLFVACAGVLQFFVQFVYRPAWLFDFAQVIPSAIRGSTRYNTVIPVSTFFKSNGFFLAEPSGFGFLMGLALIAELHFARRSIYLALFGLGLLVSYSGTGLLALCLGVLFPLNFRTVLRVLTFGAIGGVIFYLLGDALNLGLTLERVGEFDSDRKHSSGHIRYIAPMRLLVDTFLREPWTPLLGHGPGSISREVQIYEFFDPTWAKLVFEYGLLGTTAFLALFITAFKNPRVSPSVRAIFFFSWLVMGGHLLSAGNNYLILALAGMLPRIPGKQPDVSDDGGTEVVFLLTRRFSRSSDRAPA